MTSIDHEKAEHLAQFFKVFGDSTRIKIVNILLNEECTVSEISKNIGLDQSTISHQLRLLKNSKLVRSRRDGKNRYYNLADLHVSRIFEVGMEHISEMGN